MRNALLLFLISVSCRETQPVESTGELNALTTTSYNQVIEAIDPVLLEEGINIPDASGAIGRNQDGYFHVRFQLGMNTISDFTIATQRLDALDVVATTIEYAFDRQTEKGDFELSIPTDLQDLGTPLETDLASGVAFFGSSLGLTLYSLSQSDWFVSSQETKALRSSIVVFNPKVELMLSYLKSVRNMLFEVDAKAPNRLMFNAVAFQSMGLYLDDQEAQQIAEEFLTRALVLQSEAGYYIEGGVWDSSYNGVSLQLGLELFMLLPSSELKTKFSNSLLSAARWQLSRINHDGRISTVGNTRVFPGGESFLGNEKGVDYAKTVKALIYLSILAENPSLEQRALTVLDFYN